MESKWKKWIKQFPKLEEAWYQIPEPANTYFTIQIDSFAESENHKLREENERLRNNKVETYARCLTLTVENNSLKDKIKELEDQLLNTCLTPQPTGIEKVISDYIHTENEKDLLRKIKELEDKVREKEIEHCKICDRYI